jgi:hypothetical protein
MLLGGEVRVYKRDGSLKSLLEKKELLNYVPYTILDSGMEFESDAEMDAHAMEVMEKEEQDVLREGELIEEDAAGIHVS